MFYLDGRNEKPWESSISLALDVRERTALERTRERLELPQEMERVRETPPWEIEIEREREGPPPERERVRHKPAVSKEEERERIREKVRVKVREREEEKQRLIAKREATGRFKALHIHCDICKEIRWSLGERSRDGEFSVVDIDCINRRDGAIGITGKASISTETFDYSPIVITCGVCGKADKFKPRGKVPVLKPHKGERVRTQSVTIECSCGETYKLKTYDRSFKTVFYRDSE